jgi:cobalt/nickel transport protein
VNVLPAAPWLRRATLGLLVLVVLAPLFGWASGAVGYAEPLENAAERTGAADDATTTVPGLLPDYAVPGLASPLGTLVSAAVGTALTLGVAVGLGRLLER